MGEQRKRGRLNMGSMIHLSVGRLEIDWGKNHGFTDHSPLFQPSDLAQVPYYYVADGSEGERDEHGDYDFELVTERKDGLSSPTHLTRPVRSPRNQSNSHARVQLPGLLCIAARVGRGKPPAAAATWSS